MKRLRQASDVLFVLAVLLLVLAVVMTIKLLLKIAFVVLGVSVVLVFLKNRAVRRSRQPG